MSMRGIQNQHSSHNGIIKQKLCF